MSPSHLIFQPNKIYDYCYNFDVSAPAAPLCLLPSSVLFVIDFPFRRVSYWFQILCF